MIRSPLMRALDFRCLARKLSGYVYSCERQGASHCQCSHPRPAAHCFRYSHSLLIRQVADGPENSGESQVSDMRDYKNQRIPRSAAAWHAHSFPPLSVPHANDRWRCSGDDVTGHVSTNKVNSRQQGSSKLNGIPTGSTRSTDAVRKRFRPVCDR